MCELDEIIEWIIDAWWLIQVHVYASANCGSIGSGNTCCLFGAINNDKNNKEEVQKEEEEDDDDDDVLDVYQTTGNIWFQVLKVHWLCKVKVDLECPQAPSCYRTRPFF